MKFEPGQWWVMLTVDEFLKSPMGLATQKRLDKKFSELREYLKVEESDA